MQKLLILLTSIAPHYQMENNQNSLKRDRYLLIFSRILNRYVLLVNSDRSIPVMFRFHLYKRSHQPNVAYHPTQTIFDTYR